MSALQIEDQESVLGEEADVKQMFMNVARQLDYNDDQLASDQSGSKDDQDGNEDNGDQVFLSESGSETHTEKNDDKQ